MKKDSYISYKAERNRRREREAALGEAILKKMPETAADLYPAARKMRRHFILHVGPTNSGKTYEAIEGLKAAGEGAYFGPLRLLAFEQYEKLNREGYPCSLRTGEERQDMPGASFVSSTIEVADFHHVYPYAVIDEAQMAGDSSRGGAWTAAILGLLAGTIAVCLSANAEALILRLIELCGDTYEIVRHERKVPLLWEAEPFIFPKSVKAGDALIVFSKRNVHAVAAELQQKKIPCSILYGALPYDVRHEQAGRFADGINKVVVATDAIGMGMNLPIRRVVFLEMSKFDGTGQRLLKISEIRQIAGRAGRFGLYSEGRVNAIVERKRARKSLDAEEPEVTKAMLPFPETLLGLDGLLSETMRQWMRLDAQEGFGKSSLAEKLDLCLLAERLTDDKSLVYDLISLPFDTKNYSLMELWKGIAKSESAGKPFHVAVNIPYIRDGNYPPEAMEQLETDHKVCDLLYAYCEKFSLPEHTGVLLEVKEKISKNIIRILKKQQLKGRKCRYCGKALPWNHPYGMCQECYFRIYSWDDEDLDE